MSERRSARADQRLENGFRRGEAAAKCAAELEAPAGVYVLDLERAARAVGAEVSQWVPLPHGAAGGTPGLAPLATRIVQLDESGCLATEELRATIAPIIGSLPEDEDWPRVSLEEYPLVSAVVTTAGARGTLPRCINSILASDYEQLEVVVVDNRPQTTSAHALLGPELAWDARVRFAHEPRAGLSYARNAGLELARGEIVAFTDDDVVVDARWLKAISNAFAAGADCVTGLVLPLAIETSAQSLFEQFAGFCKGFERRTFDRETNGQDRLFPYAAGAVGTGANMALPRSLALAVGGFDVRLGAGTPTSGGEDLDMYIRLLSSGRKIVYEPAALVLHDHPSENRGVRRRAFNYGIGLTAMLTARLLAGPRLPLLRKVPAGVMHVLDPDSRKNAAKGEGYPPALTALERLGMLIGPIAYVRSVYRSRRSARTSPLAGENGFVPSAVGVIDLDRPLPNVKLGRREDGNRYGSLVALVRLHGDPLGTIEVPASVDRVTSDTLAAAIWSALGAQLESHGRAHGCLEPGALSSHALAAGLPSPDDRPPHDVGAKLPMVSVIVPTAGRPERIEACLASLRALQYGGPCELIVVDNAPQDGRTHAVVEACARADDRVRYFAEPLPGSSVARNRGIREAAGEILAFTDDDVRLDAQWLKWMVQPFLGDERVGVVTGLVLPARFDTAGQRWFEELYGFAKGYEPQVYDNDVNRADDRAFYPYWGGVFGSGNSMAFRSSVLRAIGGFDPALGAGSPALAGADIESFSHAVLAGSRLVYEPRAVCWHDHRAAGAALSRQVYSYSVGFTAILTKWLPRDPRLLVGVARQLALSLRGAPTGHAGASGMPRALSSFRRQLQMSSGRGMLWLQLRGYLLGPLMYVRSLLWARKLGLREVLAREGTRDG